jgi:hypothetical protein
MSWRDANFLRQYQFEPYISHRWLCVPFDYTSFRPSVMSFAFELKFAIAHSALRLLAPRSLGEVGCVEKIPTSP